MQEKEAVKDAKSEAVRLSALPFSQNGDRLFVAAIPVRQLLELVTVDRYNSQLSLSDKAQGYQRPEEPERVAQMAKYLEEPDHVVPTSIVVCARAKLSYDESTGVLNIPGPGSLYVVDGQHRLAGFRHALQRGAELPSYDLPVVVLDGFDKSREMRVFTVVNGKAKSVRVDLVRMIQAQEHNALGDAAFGEKDRLRIVLAKTAERLSRGGRSVIWSGRIVMPDQLGTGKPSEEDAAKYLVRATSFMTSLRPVLEYIDGHGLEDFERLTVDEKSEHFQDLVETYWLALKEVNPEAFAEPESYALQRTTGVFVAHLLMRQLMVRLHRVGQGWEQGNFVRLIRRFPDMCAAAFWHRKDGPAAKYLGMKGFKMLYDEISRNEEPS